MGFFEEKTWMISNELSSIFWNINLFWFIIVIVYNQLVI